MSTVKEESKEYKIMLLWGEISKDKLPYEYKPASLFLSRRLKVNNKEAVICPVCASLLKLRYPGRIGIYADADHELAKKYELERAKILKEKPKSYNVELDHKLHDDLWNLVFEASYFPDLAEDEETLMQEFKVPELFLAKILSKLKKKYGIELSEDELAWAHKDMETFLKFIADKIKAGK